MHYTKEELRNANEKIISLEAQLKSVNETADMSDAKYKEVSKNLQKLGENYIDEIPIPNALHCNENSKR